MWYVYVLQSLKDPSWFYTGYSEDVYKRLERHNSNQTTSTTRYSPFRIVYFEAYLSKEIAIQREYNLKHNGNMWVPLRKRIIESLQQVQQ